MSKKPQSDPSRDDPNDPVATIDEVPPVIIKGGSLQVQLRVDDLPPGASDGFDDPENHTKVKRANHPDPNIKILRVEIRDNRDGEEDRLLSLFDANAVEGRVDIIVFAK